MNKPNCALLYKIRASVRRKTSEGEHTFDETEFIAAKDYDQAIETFKSIWPEALKFEFTSVASTNQYIYYPEED